MSVNRRASLRNWLLSLPPVDYALQSLRELLIGSLKCGPIPKHIAFVMDGNRRYARSQKLETVEGHYMGFEALARILEVCYKSGVQVVTIFAFSIENFKRPKYEVDGLMDLAKTRLVQMSQHGELLERYGAAIRVLGDKSILPDDVLVEVERAVEMTRGNDRAVLNVCFPYTGREEITHAIRETVAEYSCPPTRRPKAKRGFSESHIQRNIRSSRLAGIVEEEQQQQQSSPSLSPQPSEMKEEDGIGSDADTTSISEHDLDASSTLQPASSQTSHSPSPVLRPTTTTTNTTTPSSRSQPHFNLPDPETITPDTITRNTYTADAPPLDLLIRTSGVHRLSDFMMWQCHETTELKFLDCLWPEFDLWQFLPVLVEWQWRQRKEGERRKVAMRREGLKGA